jgi:hypothetical protein
MEDVYIGIDPGVTTGLGIVVETLDTVGYLSPYSTISDKSHLKLGIQGIIDWAKFYGRIKMIVVEDAPMNGDAKQIVLVTKCYDWAVEYIGTEDLVKLIRPVAWKPIAEANNWFVSRNRTIHEHDALCMALYYMKFKGSK